VPKLFSGPEDRRIKRALCIVAHPDDIEYYCAGAILLMTRHGAVVDFVLATSGDKGARDASKSRAKVARIREREQEMAADVLGVKRVAFLRHPDAELVDGRIYGRGSADMKGGVAAIVAAMSALNGSQLAGDVILAATCGEEAGMVGARAMVERGSFEPGGRLVVAEPTDLNVFHGEKGVLWLKVRALGRTAHGSMPHLGINAINAIATLIPRLNGYPFPYEESALLGKPSLSVNVIQGGNKINVIPDFCEIEVDMRTIPGQDHAAMTDAVRKLADDVARDFEGLRMEIDVISDVSSLETDSSHELVLDIVKSVRSVRGADPEVGGVAYATDGAHLGPGFNMPVVICGPGAPGMAHQPDEYVETQQLTDAAEIYVDLALRTL
jgi:succinyl-diaminopimelate desuccinylase